MLQFKGVLKWLVSCFHRLHVIFLKKVSESFFSIKNEFHWVIIVYCKTFERKFVLGLEVGRHTNSFTVAHGKALDLMTR